MPTLKAICLSEAKGTTKSPLPSAITREGGPLT